MKKVGGEIREHFRDNHFVTKTMKYINKYENRLKELKNNPKIEIVSAGDYQSRWGWNKRIIYKFKEK